MTIPRPRLTIGRLMIAVALTPIVLFSGWLARDWWPMGSSVVSETSSGAGSDILEWTMVVEERFSIWPSVLAMTTTSVLLAAIWVAIAMYKARAKSRPA